MKNEIMLITYGDSLGKDFNELHNLLNNYFAKAVGSVHILPFFPSSADRGFAPTTYEKVDEKFGNYEELKKLGEGYDLMYDFMVNHISAQSEFYQDFKKRKDNSVYSEMFIRYKEFWADGEPTEAQIEKIYKRKPKAPFVELQFSDGSTEKIWCTFSEEQIDLNVASETTKKFISDTLVNMAEKGAKIIRLDAFAYAVKKEGTSCFFVEPEMWQLLCYIKEVALSKGVEILPEIHEHHSIQLKLADKGYWVYDFALPMLVLHALYAHTGKRIVSWLNKCPRKQMTTLDTHDGIGVVDVVDLLSPEEIEFTKEQLYAKGANVKKKYSSEEYNNLDIYQINCTYYSALGNNDKAYLLARAIQFFAPGIPQVYYVGLLAGENDLELLENTKEGRNINRHYYTCDEVVENLKRPVVKKLIELMEFRNSCDAFGEICECSSSGDQLEILRSNGKVKVILRANLTSYDYDITIMN